MITGAMIAPGQPPSRDIAQIHRRFTVHAPAGDLAREDRLLIFF
jgi:hypothetical protein